MKKLEPVQNLGSCEVNSFELDKNMASTNYQPRDVYCENWKKIWSGYTLKKISAPCPVCQKEAKSRCGGCYKVAYCSNEHQKIHWAKEHRSKCCPFKIVQGDPETVGRYVVATRDIKPGEIIMEEKPITVGPKQFTVPVCLGCYKPVSGEVRCPGCNWTMCGSEQCSQDSIQHISTGECKFLSWCKLKPKIDLEKDNPPQENPIFECFTPFRCLLVRDVNPNNWQVMMAMEQHTELRQQEPFYKINQTNTVNFLQQHVLKNADEATEEYSDETINAVINVLDVNAFEIRGNEFSIRGVYPLTAMMNSACSPNTQNCIDEDFTCRVRAATSIKKGQEITSTYTLMLAGNLHRRNHLKESKYFECKCQRCSDPTEFGTHFSTLLCASSLCKEITGQDDPNPGYVISTDSLDVNADWQCIKCGSKTSHEEVKNLVAILEKEISELPMVKEPFEEALTKYSKILHPNHHILVDLEFTLVQLYGRERQDSPDKMIEEAKRKLYLCNKVLDVMSKIMPGLFRIRGMFLSEMYGIILYLARHDFEKEVTGHKQFLLKLEEAGLILDEAMLILSFEPRNTIEGSRYLTALEFRVQLNKLIQSLQKKIAQTK